MLRTSKHLSIFFIMGMIYMIIEILSRWIGGAMIGFKVVDMVHSIYSATGWTSFWMLIVGGFCGLLLGLFNEKEIHNRIPMLFQSLFGALLIVLPLEFLSGLILNVWLNLGIWDYSDQYANLLGQICLKNGLLFFAITPFAFWLDDALRHYIYKEQKPVSLGKTYLRIITDFIKK